MTELDGVKVDPEFQNLCPALSTEELRQLDENIRRDKRFLDPLKVWDGLIVDGHNRLDIYRNLPDDSGINPPRIEKMQFESREEAKNWIILNQLGRRNLPPKEAAYLRGKLYNEKKRSDNGHANLVPGAKNAKNALVSSGGQSGTPRESAASQVAQQTKVSARTVKRDGNYSEALDRIASVNAKATADIRSGTLKATKKQVIEIGALGDAEIGEALRALRNGEKPAEPSTNGRSRKKPKELSPAKLVDELLSKHVGYVVRGIDKVAEINGGKGTQHKAADAALNALIKALKQMREGKK